MHQCSASELLAGAALMQSPMTYIYLISWKCDKFLNNWTTELCDTWILRSFDSGTHFCNQNEFSTTISFNGFFFFQIEIFLCQQIKTANAAPVSYSPPPLASYSPVLHSCIMSTKGQRAVKEVFCRYCLNYCTPRLLIMLKHFVSAGPMTSSPQSDIVDRQLPQDPSLKFFSIFAPPPHKGVSG